MKKVINWFKKLFGCLGDIWETFRASTAGSKIMATLNDLNVQSEAMNLVKTLANSNLSGKEKETAFNEAFTTWANNNGYSVQASLVNALRELAYTAYNLRLEKANSGN